MSNYNSYSDYDDDMDDMPRRPRRKIDFDNSEFGEESSRGRSATYPREEETPHRRPSRHDYDEEIDPESYGRRERDWADDISTRADGRIRYDDDDVAPHRASRTRQRRADDYRPERGDYRSERDDNPRRDDYRPRRSVYEERDEYYDRPHTDMPEPHKNFRKRHPVMMNFAYVILATIALGWISMWFLDFWTFHGEERVVPDVKGKSYAAALSNVDVSGLRAEISDSVFDSFSAPGTVVEQVPVAGAKIKKGGTVYLTIVAFSPKLVTVPEFYDASVRQVRSMFEGLGIKDIREVPVVSEYNGLVLGAKFNGASLQPGARIPVSAVVTLEVGTGLTDTAETDSLGYDQAAIDASIEELNIE